MTTDVQGALPMNRITSAELAGLLADHPVTVLDVRTATEYETAHIPGSISVSLDELRADAHTVASLLPDHAVVVCRSGHRAEQACQALAATGRDDLRILAGGIQAWEGNGGTVARGRDRWDLERQVRLVAGSLVLAGVLASLAWPPALVLPAGVGAGLTFAATTDTCAMGMLLAKLPCNRRAACHAPSITERFARLIDEGRPLA
jgi:rhodanese-related sulfurtransferase